MADEASQHFQLWLRDLLTIGVKRVGGPASTNLTGLRPLCEHSASQATPRCRGKITSGADPEVREVQPKRQV